MKRLELGVFLPIGNNGFVMSTASPQYHPTFEHNKQISMLAEEIGLDYVFSMSKWRGYGGEVEFWDHTLESMSLMTGLAAVTERVGLIATVNPLLFHPGLLAKMAATANDISGGRFGLNLITGASLEEYAQMGVVPDGYGPRRYEYLLEWVTVLKRLFTEDRVDHDGEFFHLRDCVSSPKSNPFLVCAGTSEEGLRFTARNADYSFLSGNTVAETKEVSQRAKAIANDEGRSLKTATTLLVVLEETQAAADAELRRLVEGAATRTIANVWSTFASQGRPSATKRAERREMDGVKISYAGRPLAGDSDRIAAAITELAVDGDLDSVLLIFPDYVEGLRRFGEMVMPLFRGELHVGAAAA